MPIVSSISHPYLYDCFAMVCDDLGGKLTGAYEPPAPQWYEPHLAMLNREAHRLGQQGSPLWSTHNDLKSLLTANIVTRKIIAQRSVLLTNLSSLIDAFIVEDWGLIQGGFVKKKALSKGPNMQQVPKKNPIYKPLTWNEPGGPSVAFESSVMQLMSSSEGQSLGDILNDALNSSAALKTASMGAIAGGLTSVHSKLIGQIKNKPSTYPQTMTDWWNETYDHNILYNTGLKLEAWAEFLHRIATGVDTAPEHGGFSEEQLILVNYAVAAAKENGFG